MSLIVPRTVTVVEGDRSRSAFLADFRSNRAYVLLGDPGAGKSTAFETEASSDPDAILVTARHFIAHRLEHPPEWRAKTLFIDALDEVRAGRSDGRRPLGQILESLEGLGNPRFRLSCRAADWLGRDDLWGIVSAAGYEDVSLLHLEPLAATSVRKLLVGLGLPDVDDFLAEVRTRGLEGMLGNPHALGLLVKAVGRGQWPRDRRSTFELASRNLARKSGEEHCLSVERIMGGAGRLSALLLLSDREYVAKDLSEDPEVLCLDEVREGDQAALLPALQSNLFSSLSGHRFTSEHRHLAEFLGARFLHRCIKSGVPIGRVLALMVGEDGIVVSELRGLSAWLAAFNRSARNVLTNTDPVGIALYGDVRRFRKTELKRLLRSLATRADEISYWSWPAVALGSLVGRHTVELLSRYLRDDDRTEGRQRVVGLLLHALPNAEGARACLDNLESAVRDTIWQPWVRHSALRALVYHSSGQEASTLIPLLHELREGQLEDPDRELQGTLLNHLYPVHVGPARIWDYWQPQGLYSGGGIYGMFWYARLLKRTNGGDMVALLQALVDRGAKFRERFPDDQLQAVLQDLVFKALSAVGERTAVSTIYDWLELINFEDFQSAHARRDGYVAVSRWLADRPKLQKRLALEGLGRIWSGDPPRESASRRTARDHSYRAMQIRWTIFGAGAPADFAEWCVRQAVDVVATRAEVAVELLDWSRPWDEGVSGTGLSIEDVRAATEGIPALRREVPLLLRGQKESLVPRPVSEEVKEHRSRRSREKAEFIAYVREHVPELKAGRCSPRLLHDIAVSYHDFFFDDRESTPRLRVAKLLGEDIDLTHAAIEGFRRVNERGDLPTLREVIRLDEQGKISLLALPILAGLDSLGPGSLDSRSPPEIARAAGLYYLTPLNVEGHPKWYRRALAYHPEPVAEALIKVTRSRVRRRQDCFHLWGLAREEAHRAVVRLAALPLLRAFPTRCTEPQISALHEVLLAVLTWGADGLEEVVRQRVAKPDLDVSQRALWLAAGLLLSPEGYVPRVVKFVEDGEEARSRHVVRFLAPTEMKRLPMRWTSRELKTMIRLLGSRYAPWRPESFGMASIVDEDRTKVEALIAGWATTLASRTDRDACDALQALVDDSGLEPWHILLKDKRDEQVLARRSATFSVPDLAAVQKTLANEEPANPADLVALVAEELEMLAAQIRRGNTDDWRQYWNEDGRRRVVRPKHEESCRDALLSDLRQRLPDGVDAQPEAQYTRGNRADIRVSFNGHGIPVEIKKDSHRRLWSAIAHQLVAKYTSALESCGYGIYLVLWFGGADMPVPPSGRRPKTPGELRERLEGQLAGPWRHRVRVIVIDVSGESEAGVVSQPGA